MVLNTAKEALLRFLDCHTGARVGVFLHTGMVLATLDELRDFFNLNHETTHYFYLPKNVDSELRLLKNESHHAGYKSRADLVLKKCTRSPWTYHDMANEGFLAAHHCDIGLFLFMEPCSAEKFANLITSENCYYLYLDPFNPQKAAPFQKAGYWAPRKPRPLEYAEPVPFEKEDHLMVYSLQGKKLSRFRFEELDYKFSGGEATLYTHPKHPHKLIKLYHRKPTDDLVTKLKQIGCFQKVMTACACPTEIVYRCGDCVGYMMDYIEGKNLSFTIDDEDVAYHERLQIAKRLITSLLELRLVQYIPTDLSGNNIRYGADGKVYIIDTDSMEFMRWCGGGFTAPFGHPDVTTDHCFHKLRKPEHSEFAFSVLFYELLMGCEPLLQCTARDGDFDWKLDRFPLTIDQKGNGTTACGLRVSEAVLERWRKLPCELRRGFSEIFNFRTSYDFGEWLIALENLI